MADSYVSLSWDYEYGSPEASIAAFVQDAEPAELANAAQAIDALLAEFNSEDERRAVLVDLAWGYAPREGMLDEFLIWTRAALREAAG